MNDWVNICQVLSWIAFRDRKLVTSDPDELRRNMRRYRKRLVESNPAGDFLKVARTGELRMQARSLQDGKELTGPFDWTGVTEDDLWKLVESEWARIKGTN